MRKTAFVAVVTAMGMALGAVPVQGEVVAYFKFDDVSGSVFTDDTGHGLLGSLGAPPEGGEPNVVPGPSGQGTDWAVSVPPGEGLVVNDDAFAVLDLLPPLTLECWVRSAGTEPQGQPIGFISYGFGGGGGYKLGFTSSGDRNAVIVFTLYGVVDVFSEVPFPFDQQWHHVAASYDFFAGVVKFYLDGVEVDSVEESRDANETTLTLLHIGQEQTSSTEFLGDIDRVRISNEVLAPEDLDTDPTSVKPVAESTVALYTFDEGAAPFGSQGNFDPTEVITLFAFNAGNVAAPAVVADSPSGQEGDSSLEFDGTDLAQLAFVKDPDGILNITGAGRDWTLEAWVKYEQLDASRRLLYGYGFPGGYTFSLSEDNPRRVHVTTLGIVDFNSETADVTPGEWHHVAVAHKDGLSLSFFVDGTLIAELDYIRSSSETSVREMFIGGEPTGNLAYTGLLDRIRISNEALTADQLDSSPIPWASVGDWSVF